MTSLTKLGMLAAVVLLLLGFCATSTQSQIVLRNPVLEYCTGTWCQYCPCGHSVIENSILPNIPNAIIIGYHGPNPSSDPWSTFAGNSIITALGLSDYPTAFADRASGTAPVTYPQWYSLMNARWNIWATVRISISQTYDQANRRATGTISVTPVNQLTGSYKLSLIFLESGLVYSQTGNAGCPGNSQAVHNHIVREMINGYLGEELNTSSPWAVGQTISKPFNYVVPANYNVSQCNFVVFVYKVGPQLSTSEIQQGEQWDATATVTSTEDMQSIPVSFRLSQNYPNPFNPTTKFDYAVSSQSFVAIKVYSLLGQEVRTLVSEEKGVGIYNAEWDGRDNIGNEVPSGFYMYKMIAGSFSETKKMLLLK